MINSLQPRAGTVGALLYLLVLLAGAPAEAADADGLCLGCHGERAWPQVHLIHATPHGVATDARTPAAGDGCASCHTAGEHPRNPINVAPQTNWQACLDCHRGSALHWDTSVHAAEDMNCGTCHRIHALESPELVRATQADTCYGCHRDVRTQAMLPSRHPIREGQTICTDCHAAHGSLKHASLTAVNLNENCLSCHAEQRGPFLFDHPAASDDCSNCHVPHGAVHEPLLVRRPPQLCQQCHLANFHPSDLHAGGGLGRGRPNANLLGRNCLSCHPKIHGSNHPSGARLTR